MSTSDKVLRDLKRGSSTLEELQTYYLAASEGINSVFFYEEYETPIVGGLTRMIVPRHLAIINGDKRAKVVALHADHCQIVKFSGKDDENYRTVAHYIKEFLQRGPPPYRETREESYRSPDGVAYHDSGNDTDLGGSHIELGLSDQRPRFIVDLTGDGCADILGFEKFGIMFSRNKGDGTFGSPLQVKNPFGSHGWNMEYYPRVLFDANGDGLPDIYEFGQSGVQVALNNINVDGMFKSASVAVEDFGINQSWSIDDHPRTVADLTGNGTGDIIGFGVSGVHISLNDGEGNFAPARLALRDFGYNSDWRANCHPRFVVDLTGDRTGDIIGFGNYGVYISLNDGNGNFAPIKRVLENLTYGSGWRIDRHPRFVLDLTGNGTGDIIGFGSAGVHVSLNDGSANFSPASLVLEAFGYDAGWRVEKHPRFLADTTGDGKPDIVGFGATGVVLAISNGDGTFEKATLVLHEFGYMQGWRVGKHSRFLADLTGDSYSDIIGIKDDGVYVALNDRKGRFGTARKVSDQFGSRTGWNKAYYGWM
ncbi:hypothetical protein FRC17_003367 [Serendipita sp. 399]|nr:hypothetical protein FRC17_003367 [Serendipita sp. 399]